MYKNVSKGDFPVCKEAADQFFYVAEFCENRCAIDYMANTFYPYSVNIAFACELYLKAIMIYKSATNEFPKGHDLKKLFDSLEDNDKQAIEISFTNKYSAKTIDEFLDKNKDVFINWRYALEKKVEIDLTGFEALADVLHEFVNGLGEQTHD